MTPEPAFGVAATVTLRRFVALTLLLVACEAPEDPAEPTSTRWVSVTEDARMWRATAPEGDPMASHRPVPLLCVAKPWHAEQGGVEVETQDCNYVSIQQPLALDLLHGDTLRLTAWWERLASEAPATGHLAVLIDGQPVWEEHVTIPGEADVRELEFEMPFDADAGSDVVFHVHNHGYNTWRLQTLQVALEE